MTIDSNSSNPTNSEHQINIQNRFGSHEIFNIQINAKKREKNETQNDIGK